VLYMHENQLTYPISPRATPDLTFGFMNWKSMLIADRVVYNSPFHRIEVEQCLPGVLKNYPDYRHLDLLAGVVAKSSVLPVGIDLARFGEVARSKDTAPLVLWNQRWEHDKNPVEMIAALSAVIDAGLDIRIALCGENFRNEPEEFLEARGKWGERLVHFGWAEEDDYIDLVTHADVVISTAEHEFFGIAVIEALYNGAAGVLPRRLSYPGILYPESAEDHLYDNFEEMVERIARFAQNPHQPSSEERAHYQQFDWSNVAPQYDTLLESLAR
jgi:glycosyltransferase involved in cell wall biosynthesis